MLDSPSDAVTTSSKQTAYGERYVAHQRHSLPRRTRASETCPDVNASVEAAFPSHIELPRCEQSTSGPPRPHFFERKYLADQCVGGMLLVLFSPVMIALYLLVRATSRGPGFYKQERVGLNGKTFEIFKLRSMVQNAEQAGKPQWAVKGDSRVNLVGRVLRRLHLDELPQLYNVCRGDMSLVGPRPERPQICEDLAKKIDGYYNRTAVRPGVTGLAQINLPPDESIDDVRRKQILDLHYIANAGLWLDTRMVFATALRMVGVKGYIVTKLIRLDRTHLTKDVCPSDVSEHASPVKLVRPSAHSDQVTDSLNALDSSAGLSVAARKEDSARFSYPRQRR